MLPWHISLCLFVLTVNYIIHIYQNTNDNSLGLVKATNRMGFLPQQQVG